MPINRQSIVSSPAQYISQFITVAYYLPGLYSGDPLVKFDTQPIEDQHGE
jgi:hypothetical protein